MSLTAKELGNAVAGTDYILALVDPQGIGPTKVFASVSYTVSSSAPTLGGSAFSVGIPTGVVGLPQLQTLTAVEATDPLSGNITVGQFKVVLAPNSADVVNASSPMDFTYSSNAYAITASTSTG